MSNHCFTTYVSIIQEKIVYTFEGPFVDITLRVHSAVIKEKQVCQETLYIKAMEPCALPHSPLSFPLLRLCSHEELKLVLFPLAAVTP